MKRRTVGTNAEDRHTWDPQGRLASWDTISGSGATTAQRDYTYDGMGRLEMVSRTQGYSIYGYDADDQMVVERHSTNGLTVNDTVYRFQGLRTRITYGIATTEDLLPFVASLNGELRWRLVEPDGHALETFRHGGQRESFEVLGAYGLPVAAPPTGDWAIDGFHGQQEDNRNSLVPMGVRHMVLRDGMWMQPEPLLYLGPTNGNLLEPTGYTGVYAGGMPTVLQDRSGRFSWAIAGLRQAASERSGKPLEQVSVVDIAVESVTSTYEAVFPAAYAPTPTTQGQPRTIGQEIEATLFWAAPLAGAVGGAASRAAGGSVDDTVELLGGASKGGTYGTVRAATAGGEVHHMPMKSALKEAGHPAGAGTRASGGPSILMETADHRALPSSQGAGGDLAAAQAASIRPGAGGSGDPEGAATALGDAARYIDTEADPAVLLRYADACHNWGPPDAEEAALRAVLHRGPALDGLERLLDLLQHRLNTLKGPDREGAIAECEHLGTEALELLAEANGLRWANLICPRGLRRLELVELGRKEHGPGARSDLEAYRSWLERNESVPPHMKRTNMMALADIDLAKLDLADGRADAAVRRLESAITALEKAKAPHWWIDRAYSVLERALG